MKVYTKREEHKADDPSGFLGIVFILCSIGIFATFYLFDDVPEWLSFMWPGLIIGALFLIFRVFILSLSLKEPKKFRAELIKKRQEYYNGDEIYVMTFELVNSYKNKNLADREFSCFTYEETDLVVNNFYDIYIKESSWAVTEVDTNVKENTPEGNHTFERIRDAIIIFILIVFFLGTLYYSIKYHAYQEAIFILIPTLFVLFVMLFNIFKFGRNDSEEDNKKD